MDSSVALLQPVKSFHFTYSICTIVTNWEEYALMKQSFLDKDFIADCEYLVADNSNGNQFDAYQAINGFLDQSNAHFIMVVHQDVRCIDFRKKLDSCLAHLKTVDHQWAVGGNAGLNGYHREYFYLTNAGKERITENLPTAVTSLDENFLLINNHQRLALSSNVGGFHFYGTDLCIMAAALGFKSYVIPFMVNHLSLGNLKDMEEKKAQFLQAYSHKFQSRFIQTTCTKFYLANSAAGTKIANWPPVFFLVKFWQSLKNLAGKSQ